MLLLIGALLALQLPAGGTANPAADSTIIAVNAVALSVAQIKSGLDQLRRAAYNQPSGRVLDRADNLRARCRAVVAEIERSDRIACRDCLPQHRQRAVNAWLENLASVARMARRCDEQLQRLASGRNTDSSAARIKRQLVPLSNEIVGALRPYEDRVREIRATFGRPAEPPRRS